MRLVKPRAINANFTLLCTLVAALEYWIFNSFRDYSLLGPESISGDVEVILKLVLAAAFYALIYISTRVWFRRAKRQIYWADLLAWHADAGAINTVINISTQPILFLICLAALFSMGRDTLAGLALYSNFSGHYQASEMFYRYCSKERGESAVTSIEPNLVVNRERVKSEISEKISSVTSIYGSQSLEMACYYEMLGEVYLQEALKNHLEGSLPETNGSITMAEAFAKKGYVLSVSNNFRRGQVSAIAVLSRCSLLHGDGEQAVALLNKALQLVTPDGWSWDTLIAIKHLKSVAAESGLSFVVQRCDNSYDAVRSNLKSAKKSVPLSAADEVCGIILVVLLLLVTAAKQNITCWVLLACGCDRVVSCPSSRERIQLLNCLTTVCLYLGKVNQADSYSRHLLELCETG